MKPRCTPHDMLRRVACTLLACVMALGLAMPFGLADGTATRLGGTDRYETMERVSEAGFATSEWAVIATGENFPDALCAASLAGARQRPVILTASGSLSP